MISPNALRQFINWPNWAAWTRYLRSAGVELTKRRGNKAMCRMLTQAEAKAVMAAYYSSIGGYALGTRR